MIALLDADILLYVASRGAEDVIDWQDGEDPMVLADFDKAKTIIRDHSNAWTQMAGCQEGIMVFSDRENPCFRNAIYPIYKQQREGYERPELYDRLSDWIKGSKEFTCQSVLPGLEADDVLGIYQTENTVIVSIDKDMLTIPGKHLNPNKEDGVITVTTADADYNWMMQTLTGDRVDNYKGAPGVGQSKAEKLLSPYKGRQDLMWAMVLEGYIMQWQKPHWRKKFVFDDPETEAIANAQCARILRRGDYDLDNMKVKLWTP